MGKRKWDLHDDAYPAGGSAEASNTEVPLAHRSPPAEWASHFIAEERASKKYFAQIPNIYDDAELTVYEFRLLVHYVRVGNCFENTQTTADNCNMSVGSVVKARNSLKEKGFIDITDSEWGTKRIVILDKWEENMIAYGGSSPGERERSPHERRRSPGELKNNHTRITYEEYRKNKNFWK